MRTGAGFRVWVTFLSNASECSGRVEPGRSISQDDANVTGQT